MKNTLGRNERLKRRKLIEQLFETGKSFAASPYRIYYSFEKLASKFPVQAGFAVSSKNFKRAVDRNRIKRLTREAYRLQKGDLYNSLTERAQQLTLFFVFTGREIPKFEEVSNKVNGVLSRLVKIVNETNTSNS